MKYDQLYSIYLTYQIPSVNENDAFQISCFDYSFRNQILFVGSKMGQMAAFVPSAQNFFVIKQASASKNKNSNLFLPGRERAKTQLLIKQTQQIDWKLGTVSGKKFVKKPEKKASQKIIGMHVLDSLNQIVVVQKDGNVTLWDTGSYKLLQSIKANATDDLVYDKKIHSSHFCARKRQLFIQGNKLKIWQSFSQDQLTFTRNKISTMYFWRDKLVVKQKEQAIATAPDEKPGSFPGRALNNNFLQRNAATQNRKIVFAFCSKNYFFVFDNQKELKIFNQRNHHIKYSFYIETRSEITAFLASDQILIYSNEEGNIFLKNLFSEQVYQQISSYDQHPQKIDRIRFLPESSEYYLICSTLEGKLLFISSQLRKNSKRT